MEYREYKWRERDKKFAMHHNTLHYAVCCARSFVVFFRTCCDRVNETGFCIACSAAAWKVLERTWGRTFDMMMVVCSLVTECANLCVPLQGLRSTMGRCNAGQSTNNNGQDRKRCWCGDGGDVLPCFVACLVVGFVAVRESSLFSMLL